MIFRWNYVLLLAIIYPKRLEAVGLLDEPCPVVETQPDFDLEQFVSKRWFIHQQAPTEYVPVERNFCVHADYTILDQKTFPWQYTVEVMNYAEDSDGKDYGGKLCAYAPDENEPAKLQVAPCLFPKSFSGAYWVLDYSEEEGYALVTGGQPSFPTDHGCTTGDGVNDSGMWVFLRSQERDDDLVTKVLSIAQNKGIDTSVMNTVDHSKCAEERSGAQTVVVE
mmetsp:Transcript_36139/g.55499  ORF Transcript_36139/g.55499 Transcript_36139/m.55499 type:complete len:222 (-) Transcript_36139:152-817(-)